MALPRTPYPYLLTLAGLFFIGLGVSLVTRSYLGTPPISSVPYVLSQIVPLTFGEFAFLLAVFFVLLEILILRGAFPREQFLQVFVGLFLGAFIDLGMSLTRLAAPDGYAAKVLTLLVGCAVIGMGVYMTVSANTIMHPADALVRLLALRSGRRFGTVKICFDASLCGIAALVSFAALGTVRGLGEGTVISAFLVGFTVTVIGTVLVRLRKGAGPSRSAL